MNLDRAFTALAVVAVVGAGVAGCQSMSHALGMDKVTPDEFRVVTKAPLVVPPDYALRPPAPGEPRPQELQPESAARAALLGQREAVNRSDGERMLAARAGADRADPLIRFMVDDEFGDLAHKDRSFADFIMFWRQGQPRTPGAPAPDPGASAPAPVDAAAEAQRLQGLTGNQQVVISRQRTTRIKLPGM